ncbi:MAG: class I SAM-dependent methyltransferase [Solirubrobacteraceae bacterium]
MSTEVDELKARHRSMWAAGEYDRIADLIWPVGQVVVDAAAIEPGMDVLDVAAGTGSVATRAAEKGAKVVACDLTPELFDDGRRRAEEAGVEIAEWVEADVEALPFEDASFDRVLSSFGAMFAPRHKIAAGELERVLRPGGTLVMSTWLEHGFGGRLFQTIGRHAPKPPEFADPPVLWGDEGHVRRMLGGVLLLAFENRSVDFVFGSVDEMVAEYEAAFGPIVLMRKTLGDGKYDGLMRDFRVLLEHVDVGEGEARIAAEYLLIVGHKPA